MPQQHTAASAYILGCTTEGVLGQALTFTGAHGCMNIAAGSCAVFIGTQLPLQREVVEGVWDEDGQPSRYQVPPKELPIAPTRVSRRHGLKLCWETCLGLQSSTASAAARCAGMRPSTCQLRGRYAECAVGYPAGVLVPQVFVAQDFRQRLAGFSSRTSWGIT